MLIVSLLLNECVGLYKHFISSPIGTFPYHFVNVCVSWSYKWSWVGGIHEKVADE